MYSIMIGYIAFYLARQNLSLAIPAICKELSYTKAEIGIVMSVASVVYGVGKCLFGAIVDTHSARYTMSIGLLFAALANVCMGFSATIPAFVVFWTFNHCFQSMGMPSCAKLLRHWFTSREIGTKWSFWATSHEIGRGLSAFIAPPILIYLGWRYMFFVPAAITFALALFSFNRLRDTPESLGLPSVEQMTGVETLPHAKDSKTGIKKVKLTYFETLKLVLSSKLVWIVSVANFFVYFCKTTFFAWGATFLMEKGGSITSASFHMVALEIAGVLGVLGSGYLSDTTFKGRRGPISTVCMVTFAILVAILTFGKNSELVSFACWIGLGFFGGGPTLLIGIAATDFVSRKAAATANGFTGTLGYVGTALAGAGTGFLADHYGWDGVFYVVIASALISAALLAFTWNKSEATIAKDKAQNASK
jgi:sugar phosphate permease